MLLEDSNTEFKEVYVNDVKKEVVAFTNTDGGTIYIGISDDGKVVGLDHLDSVMTQASSALKDGIKPDVMPFVKISSVEKKEAMKLVAKDRGISKRDVYAASI